MGYTFPILTLDRFVAHDLQPFQYLQSIDDEAGDRREGQDSFHLERNERGADRPFSYFGLKEIA